MGGCLYNRGVPRVVSLLLILGLLAGCAAPPPAPTATAAPTAFPTLAVVPTQAIEEAAPTVAIPEPAPGEVALWHAFTGDTAAAFEAIVADFNASNPYGVVVVAERHSNYFQLGQDMTAAINSGSWPGLVVAHPYQLAGWHAAGLVTPIDHFIHDPAYGLTEEERAGLLDTLWAPDYTPENEHLGVPALRTAQVLFYNVTWAEELGFDAPPATPEDFQQQACAAAAANGDGTGGWFIDTDASTTFAWFRAFGATGLREGGYAFDTPETRAAAAFLRRLAETGCAWRPANRYPDAEFAARQGLFYSARASAIPFLEAAMLAAGNEDEWQVITYPAAPVVSLTGPALALLDAPLEAQSSAWAFLHFFLQPEVQARWVRATGALSISAETTAALGPGWAAANPQWQAAQTLAQELGQPEPARPSWGVVRAVLADAFEELYARDLSQARLLSLMPELQATADEVDAAAGR